MPHCGNALLIQVKVLDGKGSFHWVLLLYYWIINTDAIMCKWPFNVVAGCSGANSKYFICCWVMHCITTHHLFLYLFLSQYELTISAQINVLE